MNGLVNRTTMGFGILILLGVLALLATVPGTPVRGLLHSGVTVLLPPASGDATGAPREYRIRTLLGCDGIPAILNPTFVEGEAADAQLRPEDPVIGVSMNGEARALLNRPAQLPRGRERHGGR